MVRLGVWILVILSLLYSWGAEACPDKCKCEPSISCTGTYVNCANRGLTRVPTNIPNDTCYLDLERNQLTTLEKGAFEGLGNLQELYLERNKLTTLQKGLFEGLTKLTTLFLYNNKLTTLQKGLFEGLTKLTTLYLYNNKLTTLQKGLFEGLTKLTKLAIEGNPLHCNCQMVEFVSFATTKSLTLSYWKTDPRCGSPGNLTGILLKNLPLQGMDCPPVNTDTPGSTDSGVISTAVLFAGTTNSDSTIMTTATDPATDSLTTATEPATDSLTIVTDPATESSTTARDLVETASKQEKGLSGIAIAYIITVPLLIGVSIAVTFVCYKCGVKKGKALERKRQYSKDKSVEQQAARAQSGPSAAQLSTDAAYDEINDHRQRSQASQRKKDGGYMAPVSQNLNRPLPPGQGKRTKDSSPSPPGNDGYISPLQTDSKAMYDSIKGGISQEHQYIELRRGT